MKGYQIRGLAIGLCLLLTLSAAKGLDFGPEQVVQAGGSDLVVGRYAMPIFDDWNSDGLNDLIVGEGAYEGIESLGKVRVYLNAGAPGAPSFSSWFYAQADGADLSVPSLDCLTAGPRLVDWDADGRKDMIVTMNDGRSQIFINDNTDADPMFLEGAFIQ